MIRQFEKAKPWDAFSVPEINAIILKDCVKCKYAIYGSSERREGVVTCDYSSKQHRSRPCQPGQCRETEVWKGKE